MPYIGNQWYNPGETQPTAQQQRNLTPDTGNTYVQGNQGLEGATAQDFANSMTSGRPWNMISNSPAGYNAAQYADPRQAQALAQTLGANVVNTRTIDSPAGNVPSQAGLDFGGGFVGNAGLIGQMYAKYGPEVANRMLQDEMRSSGGGVRGGENPQFSSPLSTAANPSFTPMASYAAGQRSANSGSSDAPQTQNQTPQRISVTPNFNMFGGGGAGGMFGGGFGGAQPFASAPRGWGGNPDLMTDILRADDAFGGGFGGFRDPRGLGGGDIGFGGFGMQSFNPGMAALSGLGGGGQVPQMLNNLAMIRQRRPLFGGGGFGNFNRRGFQGGGMNSLFFPKFY